jgi:hypothetical protein
MLRAFSVECTFAIAEITEGFSPMSIAEAANCLVESIA